VAPVLGVVAVPDTLTASGLAALLMIVSVAALAPVAWAAKRTPSWQLAPGGTAATHPSMMR
jgi:hypothetical protein